MFSRITLMMKNVNCLLTVIVRQRPLNFCQMPWFVVTSYEALWRKLKRLSNISSSLCVEILRWDSDGFFRGAVTGLISSSSPLFEEISWKERSLLCKLCLGEVEKPSTSSLTGFACSNLNRIIRVYVLVNYFWGPVRWDNESWSALQLHVNWLAKAPLF